jgi:hypothetical protein
MKEVLDASDESADNRVGKWKSNVIDSGMSIRSLVPGHQPAVELAKRFVESDLGLRDPEERTPMKLFQAILDYKRPIRPQDMVQACIQNLDAALRNEIMDHTQAWARAMANDQFKQAAANANQDSSPTVNLPMETVQRGPERAGTNDLEARTTLRTDKTRHLLLTPKSI